MPRPESGSSVTFVERVEQPVGAIIHDAVLDEDKVLLDAVSAAFALAVDRDRLAATVHAQVSSARELPEGPVTFRYADVEGSTVVHRRGYKAPGGHPEGWSGSLAFGVGGVALAA